MKKIDILLEIRKIRTIVDDDTVKAKQLLTNLMKEIKKDFENKEVV